MNNKYLSPKDVSYIKDIFDWNYLALNKYKFYNDLTLSENVHQKLNDLIDMHTDFCHLLINILKEVTNK